MVHQMAVPSSCQLQIRDYWSSWQRGLEDFGLNRFCDAGDHLSFVVGPPFTIEHAPGDNAVELAFPFCDDNRCNAVANQICERTHLRHKAVNTKKERNAGDRDRSECGKRCSQRYETTSGDRR